MTHITVDIIHINKSAYHLSFFLRQITNQRKLLYCPSLIWNVKWIFDKKKLKLMYLSLLYNCFYLVMTLQKFSLNHLDHNHYSQRNSPSKGLLIIFMMETRISSCYLMIHFACRLTYFYITMII